MDIEKPIKIDGPKYGRCKCVIDHVINNTDITYRKGESYFYEYYSSRRYYKVYLADNRSSCNINNKTFNLNFKKTHEKAIRKASKLNRKTAGRNRKIKSTSK